jgi:hypothetical protein
MRRRRFIAGIGSVAIAPSVNFPLMASAQECRLAPRFVAYSFTSDTVEWSMTIGAGRNCVRGTRYNDTIINNVQLVTPPQSGQVTLTKNAFYYQAATDFQGTDTFTFSISGTRLGISGSSTIRVLVSVK